MNRVRQRPVLRSTRLRDLLRGGLGLLAAIGLAALSFAQAAAAVGLPVSWFARLGPSFFAWQPGHRALEEQVLLGRSAPPAERLREAERQILTEEPLSATALRLAALSSASLGHEAEARTRMRLVERITRRDPVAQIWLLEDDARQDDLAGVLRRYDALLRTQVDLRPALFAKLSAGLAAAPVQSALTPYAADTRNPWFPDLLQFAGREGRAADAAGVLIGLRELPDGAAYRAAYGTLVAAMAKENRFALLQTLYPRLPGAGGREALSSPGLTSTAATMGYAPFQWNLSAAVERDARLEPQGHGGVALAVRVAPFVRGVAASRLVVLPTAPVAFSWTVERPAEGAAGGSAHWGIRCRDDGRLTVSEDLFAKGARSGVQAMPRPCTAIDLSLMVNGGTGGEETVFRVTDLRWRPASGGPGAGNQDSVPGSAG